MELILKYFSEITDRQLSQFNMLSVLYNEWNKKINVISRKDIRYLEERHILHSLSIAKILKPIKGTSFIDVGTGGGFPGIPLAIMFPESNFHLIDSIGKKTLVVQNIAECLGLSNVKVEKTRFENISNKYDFIICRAVSELNVFYNLAKNKVSDNHRNHLPNGIIYLKGGDIEEEIKTLKTKIKIFEINNFFSESFYITKKIIHIQNT